MGAGRVSVAVGVLDRDGWDARTDNLAVVDASRRRIIAVPRDLWCRRLGERVNAAWKRGGATALTAALAEHGFSIDGVVCLRRGATERALAGVEVEVPVAHRLEFLYPLEPTRTLEEGAKTVSFSPPGERLAGERIHQWLGARSGPGGAGSDLDRIARQVVFVRALLAQGFDFSRFVERPELVATAGRDPLAELARVRGDWRFSLFDCLRSAWRRGQRVLVPRHPLARELWRARERLRELAAPSGRG